jgi:Tfp pilus assembly protein PilF
LRLAPPYAVVAGALLGGVFVVRAAYGIPAARADWRARQVDHSWGYAEAGREYDRAALAGSPSGALWHAGWSRVKLWHTLHSADRFGPAGAKLLQESASRYLRVRIASPGSAWATAALSDVYMRRERAARVHRTIGLEALSNGPWPLVGDDGRIAIGLLRTAILREPNRFDYRDQMVLTLEDMGLHEEALVAMADAARVLPDIRAHDDFTLEDLPRDLMETFWKTARAVPVGEAPILSREQQLISAGQLGRQLGHLAEAEADLRGALRSEATAAGLAEDSFHLAQVLVDLGRFDEAEPLLERAARESVFEPGVAETRARIAMKQERWGDALQHLRTARRLQPRELWILLDIARVAQKTEDWDQAEEALKWAILVHPEEPAPRAAIVELFLAKGEKASARGALDEFAQKFGRTDDVARLERSMAAPLDPAPR